VVTVCIKPKAVLPPHALLGRSAAGGAALGYGSLFGAVPEHSAHFSTLCMFTSLFAAEGRLLEGTA
jgi:hypothetical protein